MKKAVVLLIVILLAFLLLGELSASILPKSLIPAEAEWVVHLDMEKFKSSHFGNLLIQEKKGGIKKKAKAFYKQTSIDLLKDVSGLTIYGLGKKKQQTVMCLNGTFDASSIGLRNCGLHPSPARAGRRGEPTRRGGRAATGERAEM